MEKLKVKPIVEDQFWIITQGNIKVGQIKTRGSNVEVQVNGNTVNDTTLSALKCRVLIKHKQILCMITQQTA